MLHCSFVGPADDGETADDADEPPPPLLDATQHVKELVQRCMKKVFGGNLGLVLVGQTRCRKKQDDGDGVRGRKWQIHRTRRAQMLRLVYAKYRRERFPAAVWQRIEAEANAPAADESAVGRFIAEHLDAVAARRAKKRKRHEAFRAEARMSIGGGGGGGVVVTVTETDDDDDGECIVQIHNTANGGGGAPMDISGDAASQ